MKNSLRVALCGLMAGLSIVIMFLAGIIPTMTIALPALAGCMLIPITAECGTKYGFTVFAVVSILGFFAVSDREAWLMYVLFFGYYPVLYGVLDRIRNGKVRYAVKLLIYTAACLAESYLAIFILGIPLEEMGNLGIWSYVILLALAEVVFMVYDRAIRNLIVLYFARFRKPLMKILGKK
ncbi:MAG: hypothetical protein Q4C42_01270 [Clostridia bacterium]|nr:hypothetical protein [Clostridia bacterium]